MKKYKFQSKFLENLFYSINSNNCKLKRDPFSYLYGKFSISIKEAEELNINFPKNLKGSEGELGRGQIKLSEKEKWLDLDTEYLHNYWQEKLPHEDTIILIHELIDILKPPKKFKINILIYFLKKSLYKFLSLLIFRKIIFIQSKLASFDIYGSKISAIGSADSMNIEFVYDWSFVEDTMLDKPLLPHTDSGRKLISLLLPMSINNDNTINGTSIYLSNSGKLNFSSNRGRRNTFVEVFRSKHEIGSFIAFPKTLNSWHGVESSKTRMVRKTLLLNVYRLTDPFH